MNDTTTQTHGQGQGQEQAPNQNQNQQAQLPPENAGIFSENNQSPPQNPQQQQPQQQQNQNQNTGAWWSSIQNEELRKDADVINSKTLDDYVKQAQNAKKLIGGKLSYPTDPNDTEAMKKYREALSIPSSADQYKLTEFFHDLRNKYTNEGISLDASMNEQKLKEFETLMYDLSVPIPVAQKFLEMAIDSDLKSEEFNSNELNRKVALDMRQLKANWGSEFQARTQQIQNALNAHPELVQSLQKSGLSADPALMELLYLATTRNSEGTLPDGLGGAGNGRLTPATALEKIKSLKTDSDFLKRFNSGDDNVRKAAMKEMQDLRALAGNQ